MGIINLLYFLLRLQATEDFLAFMFEMETIGESLVRPDIQISFQYFVSSVDMLTLPPLFMSVWIERTWIGLRFFRFLIWFNFPDIMVYLRVITNSSTIRLAQVQTYWMKNMPTYFKSSSSPFQLLSYIIGGLMWFAGLLFLLGSDNTILFSFTIQKIHSLFIVVIWVKCLITIMFQQHPRNWTFDVLFN